VLNPSTKKRLSIKKIKSKTPQVSKINALTGRNSRRFKFIEADLALKVRELEKAHFVANQIENRIKSRVPHVRSHPDSL